jgi:imidazolonepropionase-like amidohydrolase
MKSIIAILLLLAGNVFHAQADKLALVGGTVVDPADGKITENAVVTIDGDQIKDVGSRAAAPAEAKTVDCRGKFILPGYIDGHVHFFQSGDLFTRPDAVDLTSVRSYADEISWAKSHLEDVFARYLRSGITSVVDVGGPFWNFKVRDAAGETAKAPRVAVAGPLMSSVSRPQLDLGDPPIVRIDTPDQAREFVAKLAPYKPDLIKIWYIVDKDHPVESFRPVVRATIQESHAKKLRVAVHATELETARASVEEGADVLVHSVTDKLVDDRFIQLLKEKNTILCPTLVVFERYGRTFANRLNLTAEEKAWGNPEVIASLDVTRIDRAKLPERIKTALANPEGVLEKIDATYKVAMKNLKALQDGGVTIAAGTDAGNIGTIHGPSLFREFELMKEAGLTPAQILRCATINGAQLFGGDTGSRLGSVEKGKLADLVILNSNPVNDIARASDIHLVVKGGVVYPAGSLLP